MNKDFFDFLRCLIEAGARFIVVGAHAMAVHGVPRATGDLDVWIARDSLNAAKVWAALEAFGAPVRALGILPSDLEAATKVIQIGVPPSRLDVFMKVSGLEFEDAWTRRQLQKLDGIEVPFLSRADLIANKRASGRTKDLADIEALEQ